jgi:outer membrane lipoprotein-sorting protein
MRQVLRACAIAAAVAMLVVGVSSRTSAQTVDELLAKNYQSRGGLEKLKALTTMKMTGRISTGGAEMTITTWMKRPDLMRQEMEFQGQKLIQAFDGTRAWAVNPMMGTTDPIELPAAQADLIKTGADFDGALIDYKAKGNVLEIIGTDTIDGAKAIKLKVTKKTGAPLVVYLDATTGLERKMTTEIDQGGQKVAIETLMSNYKDVSGVQIPFSVQSNVNGQLAAQVTIESVEFNVPMEDSLFKMPAK